MGKMVLSYSRDENISRENRICGSAGIGRQARLRILCWLQRVGSSPIFRSDYEYDKYSRNAVFIVFFVLAQKNHVTHAAAPDASGHRDRKRRGL